MSDCSSCYSLHSEQEHAVVMHAEPDLQVVTTGEQGPPGLSAFNDWKVRNPGGTWAEFMSELGTGLNWTNKEW